MPHTIDCPTQLIHPEAQPPVQSKDLAAGHDIRCVGGCEGINEELWDEVQRAEWAAFGERGYVDLRPGDGFLFRTGFAQAIDDDYCCLLWDRSGMGGVKMIHRCAGVIDPDYRGEWFVRLVNLSTETHRVNVGDKIIQGVYQERVVANCPIVDSLDDTDRGEGGFGSTDEEDEDFDSSTDLDDSVNGSASASEGDTVDRLPDHLLIQQEPVAVTEEDFPETTNEPLDSTGASESAPQEEATMADPVAPPPIEEVKVPDTAPEAPAGYRYGRVVVYDGRNAPHAMAGMRDRQTGSAVEWIKRDAEFFPNGTPEIVPETLRSVPGRQAVAFNPLVPTEG